MTISHSLFGASLLLLAGAIACPNPSFALAPASARPQALQEDAGPPDGDIAADDKGDKEDSGKEKKKKTLEELTKDHEVFAGLFTLYRDPESGAVHMAIDKDQIGQEYIYFTQTLDGVLEAGHFRGNFRDNAVFSIRRHFDRIEFVEENTRFWFEPDSPLARAADANISPAVLAVAKIAGESEDGKRLLVKADGLFLSEALTAVAPVPDPENKDPRQFKLGKLSKEKSKIVALHNYPANSDVEVQYVFENPQPLNDGSDAVTDARAVSVTMRHTLIAMPENDYVPRIDDPRVGYFFERVTDLTSMAATPYRDLIHRWHLKKKDPEAAISEPVEPIVFWLENTTPLEYRDTLRNAVLAWNEAFEAAGFRNAVEVRQQPDDADWDAGDIRYNVLRWTSSPRPPFGGYGPSFVNPRTGQILGADIMLEHSFVTNRLWYDKIFSRAALGGFEEGETPNPDGMLRCTVGETLHLGAMFGRTLLRASGIPQPEEKRLVKEALYYLALHEVGHTLGLNHNMKASQLHSLADIDKGELTAETGLTGSVMDYPAINVAPEGVTQGQFYTTKAGPYDIWAIQFGYSPDLDDPAKRAALLARSSEPALAFGNDADDMRAPGKAVDPRVMIGDMSSDAIDYAVRQIRMGQDALPKLRDRIADDGESWHELRSAYLVLTGNQGAAAGVISRYIGGVMVDRAFVGQATDAPAPFVPVSDALQKKAMAALAAHVFAPDAFAAPADLLDHLQMQRRGFDFFEEPEDPRLHDRVLNIQKAVLAHLLHPTVQKRITDAGLYGNRYDLAAMMADLTDAVFKADEGGDVNSRRRNLQTEYVLGVANIAGGKSAEKYDHNARAIAFATLRDIDERMQKARRGDASTRAHRQHIRHLIEQALYPGRTG
ncbi:MAG: zinc-dependent metalloprotease [Rhodothalassiaceae bacterium]